MEHLYAFFDAASNGETFYVQCEWFNNVINLDDTSIHKETEYALMTVTDLNNYWQCTITHELLYEHFKVSNALRKEQRNEVLMSAFLGQSSINESKLEWKVTHSDQDKLQLKLRTFDGDIAFVAGFILLTKSPKNQTQELQRLWFKHSALASRRSTEINKCLQQRTLDIEKTNTELKEAIESMLVRESKNKFVLIDKFVRILNEKKRKIFLIQNELKKRPREQEEEREESIRTSDSPERQVKLEEIKEEVMDSDEDLLEFTQTVR